MGINLLSEPEQRRNISKGLKVYYHLLSDETIHYRLHTTPEGEVAKVEKENKIKSKVAWEELKPVASKE
jgi:hypothetical protein